MDLKSFRFRTAVSFAPVFHAYGWHCIRCSRRDAFLWRRPVGPL